ncbi:hypothetical protein [Paucibacter soli]|uniref:hypothetical protein n=1 Tax=Paucibacter soli TaxID=3133433 RepID=UPI00309E5836
MKALTEALSHRLQQAERLQVQQLAALTAETQQLLKQHVSSLSVISSAVLFTTENAMAANQERLRQISAETTALLVKDLTALHRTTLRQVKRLLMLPLFAALCLSLLTLTGAASWAWLTVRQANAEAAQARRELPAIQTRFCASPAGRQYCRPAPSPTPSR